MESFEALNEVMVALFREINEVEERSIITQEFGDITNNDMHVIEAIGTGTPRNMTAVARALGVTTGTLTISMNSLVKKGYVQRVRSEEDRRVVLVSLTEKGKRAFDHHKRFHDEMIRQVLKGLDGQEQEILRKALLNLMDFFEKRKG